MMNTRSLNVVKNKPPAGRSYLWDMKWVRPFESPIGVYMNFRYINALMPESLKYIVKTCEIKTTSQDMQDILKNYSHYKFGRWSIYDITCFKEIIEQIYPQEQLCFPMITGDYYYSDEFRVCPECMKQGYHTMLSQIMSEEKCPIHDIEYIVNEDFDIGWDPKSVDEYTEKFGVPFPLPCKRNEFDYSLVGKRLQELFNGSFNIAFIKGSTDFILPDHKAMEQKIFVRSIGPDFDIEQYAESVWEYYIQSMHKVRDRVEQQPESTRYISGRNSIAKEHFDSKDKYNYLGSIMTLACLYDYISEVDIDDYPYEYPDMRDFLTEKIFPSENISAAKASFCYAVRGCWYLYEIFDPMYIYSNWFTSKNVNNDTGACIACYYDYQFEKYLSDFWHYSDYRQNRKKYRGLPDIISSMCIKDHIEFLGQKYLEHISTKQEFNFYTEWESIRPIMYEIDENQDGSIDIYRLQL